MRIPVVLPYREKSSWKTWIVWAIIVAWLSIERPVMVSARAQISPMPHRRGLTTLQGQQETTEIDVGKQIVEIARGASRQNQSLMADLVLVIDGSRSMKEHIGAIEKRLVDVAGVFEEGMIDYRFAQILFRKSNGHAQTIVRPFTSNLIDIQDALYKLRTSHGDRAPGYGLDAILEGLNEIVYWSA